MTDQAQTVKALEAADDLLSELGNMYGSLETPHGRNVITAIDKVKAQIRAALGEEGRRVEPKS